MLPARRRPTYPTSLPTPTSFDAGSAKKAASMLVKSAERGILRKHGKALASLVASKVKDLGLNQPLHSGCYTEDEDAYDDDADVDDVDDGDDGDYGDDGEDGDDDVDDVVDGSVDDDDELMTGPSLFLLLFLTGMVILPATGTRINTRAGTDQLSPP